jgi:hypothetical protein
VDRTRRAYTPGVSTLFASRLAPDVAIALQQTPGLGVRDLSRALLRTASSVQRALPALRQAGIALRHAAEYGPGWPGDTRTPDLAHSLN